MTVFALCPYHPSARSIYQPAGGAKGDQRVPLGPGPFHVCGHGVSPAKNAATPSMTVKSASPSDRKRD
jgi:hypothetical protein